MATKITRSYSEFSFKELEEKLGELSEYQSRLFSILKDGYESTEKFVTDVRAVCLKDWSSCNGEKIHRAALEWMFVDVSDEAFDRHMTYNIDRAWDVIVNGRCENSLEVFINSEARALISKIISTMNEMGYIREEFSGLSELIFQFEWLLEFLPDTPQEMRDPFLVAELTKPAVYEDEQILIRMIRLKEAAVEVIGKKVFS